MVSVLDVSNITRSEETWRETVIRVRVRRLMVLLSELSMLSA